MSDYASELAERDVNDELRRNGFPDGHDDLYRLVEGAIREALAKAAEEASMSMSVHEAWDAIRALGAK